MVVGFKTGVLTSEDQPRDNRARRKCARDGR